jgi:hypothetical protein
VADPGGRSGIALSTGVSSVNVDRAVLTFAGSIVLLSLGLAWFVHPYWLLLTAFVGLNLLQAAFTGFCPAAIIFQKLGLKTGPAFERPQVQGR